MPVAEITYNQKNSVPSRIELETAYIEGGQGRVYKSVCGNYAVKIFKEPKPDLATKRERLISIMNNMTDSFGSKRQPDERMLRPLAIVDRLDGAKCTGCVMEYAEPESIELAKLILSPKVFNKQVARQKITWRNYLQIAYSVAELVDRLHSAGYVHTDIHFRNFLADTCSGKALMLELDGVIVQGEWEADVEGMPEFCAPEIHALHVKPNKYTDLHSLAVLLLHILLFRNVMQTQMSYAEDDPAASDKIGFGEMAVFSEHPDVDVNRPSNLKWPIYMNREFSKYGCLSYRLLPPGLQLLADTALVQYLNLPGRRPRASAWLREISNALDGLHGCSVCGQEYPYPYWLRAPYRRFCPFCGTPSSGSVQPLVLEVFGQQPEQSPYSTGRRIVLASGAALFQDMISPPLPGQSFRPSVRQKIGLVDWDKERKCYRIKNESQSAWGVLSCLDGKAARVEPDYSIHLHCGLILSFGADKLSTMVLEQDGKSLTDRQGGKND